EDQLMHTITNNYRDAHILNLGSSGKRGPYLVTQTGVSRKDPLPKERMFVLRPDGRWVDFNAYACQGKPEAMDEIVFPSIFKLMATLGRLMGRPQVVSSYLLAAPLRARVVSSRCCGWCDAGSLSSSQRARRCVARRLAGAGWPLRGSFFWVGVLALLQFAAH